MNTRVGPAGRRPPSGDDVRAAGRPDSDGRGVGPTGRQRVMGGVRPDSDGRVGPASGNAVLDVQRTPSRWGGRVPCWEACGGSPRLRAAWRQRLGRLDRGAGPGPVRPSVPGPGHCSSAPPGLPAHAATGQIWDIADGRSLRLVSTISESDSALPLSRAQAHRLLALSLIRVICHDWSVRLVCHWHGTWSETRIHGPDSRGLLLET